jgi:glycosyltransferase involved in cell wall biosynthesis
MRLAYLSTDPGVALGGQKGAAVHVGELVAALAAQGDEVLVLVARDESRASPPGGVTVEVVPGPAGSASAIERVAMQPSLSLWLARRLRRFGAEVLYERLALHSGAGVAAARAAGVPHVVELNAPLPAEAARYRRLEARALAEQLERAVLGSADLVLAVSRPLAGYARARGARHVEVVPNAVTLERFPRPADHLNPEPVAVFAGSLRPWHGIETVAAAWRLLGGCAPRLLVLGQGPAAADLTGVGAELAGGVPHAKIPAALMDSDIGLVPYGSDAPRYFSPLKLFEYMAAGLAVVASAIPGVTDVVSAKEARLVPAGDPHRLAGAVAELASAPGTRLRMGTHARELVASRHTWAHRARSLRANALELCTPRRVPA